MDFTSRTDPLPMFDEWLNEAIESEPNDPNAMAVATVDGEGMPNVRMVLLKGHDERGFVFYTNFEGTKGREVLASRKTALLFHWKSRRRQIRIRGDVEIVSDEEADAYYNSRHPQSRLGAWASDQSRPLESRQVLIDKTAAAEAQYGTENIPRPPHWSGFRVMPKTIEFWQDGDHRLHDRIVFTREGEGWSAPQRLYP
ncbi:MAG: pyridoxamine 5'-phosphate oxidase [Pseudomonadota bacterium]